MSGALLRLGERGLTLVLAWAVGAPILLLVWQLATRSEAWRAVAAARTSIAEALFSSIALSALSALLCTLLALLWSVWISRCDFRLRRLARLLPLLPLSLPPLVGVLSFLFLAGDVGLLQGLWQRLFDSPGPPPLEGFAAVLLVHVYSFLPLSYLLLRDAMESLDADIDAAARSLGASQAARVRKIWWPQLKTAAFASLWMSFLASMASFSAPYLLGGGRRYLSTEILARRLGGELELAQAETVILAAVSLGLLFVRPSARPHAGGKSLVASALGPSASVLSSIATCVLLVIALLPQLTVLLLSFVADGTWTWQPLPPSYTWANHVSLFQDRESLRPLLHSVAMAAPAVLVGALWSIAIARVETLERGKWATMATWSGSLAWAIPATALAMAWLAAYNSPQPAGFGLALASTPFLLPVAYCLRFMPLQIRAASAALASRGAQLEWAARSLGASAWTASWQITFPTIRPALVGATALAFVLAIGEFVVSVLLYVPDNRPVSIAILAEMRVFHLGASAAMGSWLAIFLAAILILVPESQRTWNAPR